MSIVVTGATGLIGQHLVTALSNTTGHEVIAVGRRASTLVQPRVQWVTADLTNAAELRRVLPGAAEIVIHLAQSAHYRDFPEAALDVFEVNVASTARLLDWSRRAKVRHFILASSGGVAVEGLRGSYYLASKASAELLLDSYAKHLQTLALRFFFVYGQGQKPWMLVPRLIEHVRTGRPIELSGAHGAKFNPVHVEDVVNAILAAIRSEVTGCIDVAGPDVLSVREMGEAIARCVGRSAVFASHPDAAAIDVVGDITAMSQRLVPPQRHFAEAVDEVVRLSESA